MKWQSWQKRLWIALIMIIEMHASGAQEMTTLKGSDRVAFLGDSITDGFTYPLMIQQALSEAGKPVPTLINCGVASDTAALMLNRLERDVLSQKPTLVCLSVGANDANRNVSLETYKEQVTTISNRLKNAGIPMLILTTTIFGPSKQQQEKNLDEYNIFLRSLAKESGYALADVNALMQAARKKGDTDLIMPDEVHLTYHGYEVMTQAVMQALNYGDLPLPKRLTPPPYPGVIQHWKMRAVANERERLDENSVANIHTDSTWKDYELPEKSPVDGWWLEHERQRGSAVSLERELGKAPHYCGIAEFNEAAPRQVLFKVGASLETLWLNGTKLYAASEWKGWHLGREQVTAELKQGRNNIVIETGGQFILTMTDVK